MTRPEFGPFEPVFARGELPVPAYLCLLHLFTPSESRIAIERIRAALDGPGRDEALHVLLRDVNWRPHLVAAVALLLIEDPGPSGQSVTRRAGGRAAVRAGSWVTPQLLAVAAVRDPEFLVRAAAREREASPKELSAFLALCDATSQGEAWAARVRGDADLQNLLAGDVDDGGGLATRWLARVRPLLSPT